MDVDGIAGAAPLIPGEGIDFANKLLKPVANHWTTYRTLWESVLDDRHDRAAFRSMARWVADNPGCPSRAWREWVGWLYRDNALVRGAVRLRGRRVDLSRIEHNVLVVTADGDHITPPENTVPLLDLVSSGDVTHLARPGGHIGLMAGSRAHAEIWPDISDWLADRS
jgi:polyhydroxyalkanoate synthase